MIVVLDDKIYRLLENKIDVIKKEERLEKDAERYKTLDEVFDHKTLLTLYKLFSTEKLETLDFPISSGKEANIFLGTDPDGKRIAVKIYRVTTSTFRTFGRYIEGDPRFRYRGRDRRKLVSIWAKKEYKNLMRIGEAGVTVPTPFHHHNNILLMEYIGDEYTPAPLLKDTELEDPASAFDTILGWIETMYTEARFVHGDVSEYNILVWDDALVMIDVAQGVLLDHPMAEELLERDVGNICRYFQRIGVKEGVDAVENIRCIRSNAAESA